jgi:hypothetical protein
MVHILQTIIAPVFMAFRGFMLGKPHRHYVLRCTIAYLQGQQGHSIIISLFFENHCPIKGRYLLNFGASCG